ncbi:cytochrome P450 [Multifurca ochricompacta]|uniref:Cytochrome P450 n=1 Tax=Multifurca ochricompacta TaxID=376703 RepID=A0AAD4QN22_9AGAM|nr:cytochrome P450 [Multifurca ochricompacta]
MNSVATYLALLVVASIIFVVLVLFKGTKSTVCFPPGPRGLPLVGNVLDMPKSHPWEAFNAWGKKWGPITHITLFGQHFIIINSLNAAIKMLEVKSSIYSDRPTFPVLGEIMGWESGVALCHYGERFRAFRRLFHQAMGTRTSVLKHYPVLERETHRFLQRLLESPDQLMKNLQIAANATILDVAYGYKVRDLDDPIVHITELANDQFARASIPGAFLADVLPFLRYVPDWFPGTGWKQLGREWGVNVRKMVETPFEFAKRRRAAGVIVPSFTDDHITERTTKQEEDLIKWAASSITMDYFLLSTFFLAMTLYPEVQKKAWAELDSVVGSQRLPTLADRDSLPYISGLIKEVLRWGPAAPLAGPHRLIKDDEQDGYFIPKGSSIIVNVWGMMRDESIYSDPTNFKPERFIVSEKKPAEIDPQMCFGFGRRVCPGMRVAEMSLFLFCATTLAVYEISKAIDASGAVLYPRAEYTSCLICHPMPFQCVIKPRSENAATLIRSLHVADG